MSEANGTVWTALDGGWLYLGRPSSDGYSVVTLKAANGHSIAPAFRSPAAAVPFLERAPKGIELLEVGATDMRAKEEWLRATVAAGAASLRFDPQHPSLHATASIGTEKALWYILSYRNATACI